MFREIREIKKEERITQQNEYQFSYRRIKPSIGITVEEADEFWENVFNPEEN